MTQVPSSDSLKKRWYRIIFETKTPAGKWFDMILLILILISVVVVIMESMAPVNRQYGKWLRTIEWIITLAFTVEYIIRIMVVRKPFRYIFSFYGIIDFLAVIPTYIGLFLAGTHSMVVIRALRLLRIFRIMKFNRYMDEGSIIARALIASRRKIAVFLFGVFTVVIIIGTLMHLIEGPENGFSNIPRGIYWSIVTLTTVGYGDLYPATTAGRFIASFVMILGYAIIAVPTGIVTAEMSRNKENGNTRKCQQCGKQHHQDHARYCNRCGTRLPES
ncbi:MAG TPA: ion transporter [Bacteroidetes bacterium]|nr:ion transporter [Bacteroidota bacterium]